MSNLLTDIVDAFFELKDKTGDVLHAGKAKLYYKQAEFYKGVHEEKIYNVFRQRSVQEYRKIVDKEKKGEIKTYISKYLQRIPK